MANPFDPTARSTLETRGGTVSIYRLGALEEAGIGHVPRLPCSIKVLLEAVLRNCDGQVVTREHVEALAGYRAKEVGEQEIPFNPGRVVLQDFTGVPAVVDFAALRAAMHRMGGQVSRVNPLIRADLVIDHSVQVDAYGSSDALAKNTAKEFERNRERYTFLKWGQQAFDNFSVIPPETGIIHQVNLEFLAGCVLTRAGVAFPDSLVGTDSHTTMINGLGVLGWGVGGIEAEACMLGQPIYMLVPEVVGFRLEGSLGEGVTATDAVLKITQELRSYGVVGKFVEFHGPGLDSLSLADRATIANMAPEYGATMGFFPVDQKTVDYLRLTGRSEEQIELVERYTKLQGLWRDDSLPIEYSDVLRFDLGSVRPALAGPKRPQDRIELTDMKPSFRALLSDGHGRSEPAGPIAVEGKGELRDGAVVIAAITSCTNTSNPGVMLAAGLVAKKAHERGLRAKPWVKTSLAPGSRVVSEYLDKAGLTEHLEAIGFYTVGYGCTTCIGNSGPLDEDIVAAIREGQLVVTSVLSGNRNFEGRVSPHTRGNYLASPPLVVAYALAGTVDLDLEREPLAVDAEGREVYLRDLWPTNAEVNAALEGALDREQFLAKYADPYAGGAEWQALEAPGGELYAWSEDSTYVQEPPFFVGMSPEPDPIRPIEGARVLVKCGDSITTDHISPAGPIAPDSVAGRYLRSLGVAPEDFNSFGSRRGNDRVMVRGTFANIRLRNQLAPGTEGGFTTYLGPAEDPEGGIEGLPYTSEASPRPGEVCSIYDASVKYQKHGIPLVVLAGKDYGMGSSRDWAAKGTYLLGVRAVIAESFERIHRSNLVGMGVLPLEFAPGENAESLGLTGKEVFQIPIGDDLEPLSELTVRADEKSFRVRVRIDTPVEVDYFRNGGILHTVLRRLAKA
ncbi:MAG: aconitate hydratase AcnA [Planctomycetota bacterium]|nr:MAG: aconitate hydratase AcnA [Planctomycetota bacterium]